MKGYPAVWFLNIALLMACNPAKNAGVTAVKALVPDTTDIENNHVAQVMESIEVETEMRANSGKDNPYLGPINPEYQRILDWFKPDSRLIQNLWIQNGVWQTVTGKMGTEITINTSDFEGADRVGNKLYLCLMELTDKLALIKAGVQTMSSGRPLDCLGAIYLQLTDGKRIFSLKPGSSVWVRYPQKSNGNHGVFYSSIDNLGKMISVSGRQVMQTTRRLLNDGNYHSLQFTSDSNSTGSVTLLRIKGNKLKWQRTTVQYQHFQNIDTIDYQAFTEYIFKAMDLHSRSFMVPVGQKMIALENINGVSIQYRTGEEASMMEMHYTTSAVQNYQDFTAEENKPMPLSQTGWIQFSRFLPAPLPCDVAYHSNETGNITAGVIYLISKKTNTILMSPWLPENDALSHGQFTDFAAGQDVVLVAVIRKDDAYFTGQIDLKTGSNQSHEIHFQPMSSQFSLASATGLMLP